MWTSCVSSWPKLIKTYLIFPTSTEVMFTHNVLIQGISFMGNPEFQNKKLQTFKMSVFIFFILALTFRDRLAKTYSYMYNNELGFSVRGLVTLEVFANFGLFGSDNLSDCFKVQIKIIFLFENTKFEVTFSLFRTCTEKIVVMFFCLRNIFCSTFYILYSRKGT